MLVTFVVAAFRSNYSQSIAKCFMEVKGNDERDEQRDSIVAFDAAAAKPAPAPSVKSVDIYA